MSLLFCHDVVNLTPIERAKADLMGVYFSPRHTWWNARFFWDSQL